MSNGSFHLTGALALGLVCSCLGMFGAFEFAMKLEGGPSRTSSRSSGDHRGHRRHSGSRRGDLARAGLPQGSPLVGCIGSCWSRRVLLRSGASSHEPGPADRPVQLAHPQRVTTLLAARLAERLGYQLLSDGLYRRLSTVAHTELTLHLLEVASHGFVAQTEELRDLVCSFAHRHQPQNS